MQSLACQQFVTNRAKRKYSKVYAAVTAGTSSSRTWDYTHAVTLHENVPPIQF